MNGRRSGGGRRWDAAPVSSPPPLNVSDSPQRSRHFRWETARRGNLTCHAATLITLICTSMFCTLSPWILRCLARQTRPLPLFHQFCQWKSGYAPDFWPSAFSSVLHTSPAIHIDTFICFRFAIMLPWKSAVCCDCCMKCQTSALKNVLLNQNKWIVLFLTFCRFNTCTTINPA